MLYAKDLSTEAKKGIPIYLLKSIVSYYTSGDLPLRQRENRAIPLFSLCTETRQTTGVV